MRLTIQQLILYILFGLLAYQAANARGTESGGGGTTVVKDGQRVLLDYLVLDPEFRDINQFGHYKQLIFPEEFLRKVEDQTFSSKLIDFDNGITLSKLTESSDFFISDPFQLALQIFKEWNDDNLLNVSTDNAYVGLFHPVTWLITNKNIQGPIASVESLKDLNLTDPKLSAYYLDSKNTSENKRIYLISLSAKTWNELGLLSQSGLLVHEGLRHFQIRNGQPSEFYFDDSVLQKATAITMLCKPRPTLSMYLSFILNNKEKQAEALPQYGSFSDVIKKYCSKRNFKGSL